MFGGTVEDRKVSILRKLKLFFSVHWRGVVTIASPLIFIGMLVPLPPANYQWCAYCLLLMATYWVTECIPLPVTSFLPIVIFPITGVMSAYDTCLCYMNDTVLMFLGSLFLAYSVEQSGLHKRMALCAIRAIGYSHKKLLFAMSFITMFVSMWITNTAATTMMVPINFALLKVFEDQQLLRIYEVNSNGDEVASDITTCYFCAATFAATIGGIGTLVGTATNLVFKGLFMIRYPDAPEYLSFPLFSAFAIPYMIVLNLLMYLYLIVVYMGFMRPNSKAAKDTVIPEQGVATAKRMVDQDWKDLGSLTFWEFMTILLFGSAMILFFSRSPQLFYGWGDALQDAFNGPKGMIRDSAVAMLVVSLMCFLPNSLKFFRHCTAKYNEDLPNSPAESVLVWAQTELVMPYSFAFLLGGGFALSQAAGSKYSDLNGRIGDLLEALKALPNSIIILILIIATIFITNFASNVAVCNIVTPICMGLAEKVGAHPLWYNIVSGFCASFCFCVPVGTPGNLVVQGAAKIPTMKMIVAGIGPTISTIIVSWIAFIFWAPIIWPALLKPKEF